MHRCSIILCLKVLSYWNLNILSPVIEALKQLLKVLSYWNLNKEEQAFIMASIQLKVLSYWNLNGTLGQCYLIPFDLKYYHIGI